MLMILQTEPFLTFFADALGRRGFRVVRFEYPYMASKQVTASKNL